MCFCSTLPYNLQTSYTDNILTASYKRLCNCYLNSSWQCYCCSSLESKHKWNTSHCQIYFQLHNLKKSIVFMCEKCCRNSTEGTMKDEVIIEKTSLSWDRQSSSKAGDSWVDIVKIWYWSYKAFYLMAELIEGISLYSDLAKRWVDGWVNEFKTN